MGIHLYTYKNRSTSLKALGIFLQNVFPAKERIIRWPINFKWRKILKRKKKKERKITLSKVN